MAIKLLNDTNATNYKSVCSHWLYIFSSVLKPRNGDDKDYILLYHGSTSWEDSNSRGQEETWRGMIAEPSKGKEKKYTYLFVIYNQITIYTNVALPLK